MKATLIKIHPTRSRRIQTFFWWSVAACAYVVLRVYLCLYRIAQEPPREHHILDDLILRRDQQQEMKRRKKEEKGAKKDKKKTRKSKKKQRSTNTKKRSRVSRKRSILKIGSPESKKHAAAAEREAAKKSTHTPTACKSKAKKNKRPENNDQDGQPPRRSKRTPKTSEASLATKAKAKASKTKNSQRSKASPKRKAKGEEEHQPKRQRKPKQPKPNEPKEPRPPYDPALCRHESYQLLLDYACLFDLTLSLDEVKLQFKSLVCDLKHSRLNKYWTRPACGVTYLQGLKGKFDVGTFQFKGPDSCRNWALAISLRCAEMLAAKLNMFSHMARC